jgi:hypothetical protein
MIYEVWRAHADVPDGTGRISFPDGVARISFPTSGYHPDSRIFARIMPPMLSTVLQRFGKRMQGTRSICTYTYRLNLVSVASQRSTYQVTIALFSPSSSFPTSSACGPIWLFNECIWNITGSKAVAIVDSSSVRQHSTSLRDTSP